MGRKKKIEDADLLQCARAAFVEKGFSASTRDIARRAGVSEGILFQRYPTKADLFYAAMVVPTANVEAVLKGRGASTPAGLDRIALAMVEYFREVFPVLVPLLAHPGFRFEEFARVHPGSPLATLRRELMLFFTRQREAGRIRAVDPGGAALLLFAVAECVAFFERMGAHGGRLPDILVERAMRCLWVGLAPARPRKRRSTIARRGSSPARAGK